MTHGLHPSAGAAWCVSIGLLQTLPPKLAAVHVAPIVGLIQSFVSDSGSVQAWHSWPLMRAIELLDQDEDMTNEEGEERLPVQDRFVSQWDLAIELPPVAVDWFNVLVGAFLHKPLKARTGNLQQDESFTQQFVETFASQKLMPVISELQRDYHGTSTALDFVILSCRALALDPSVEEECVRARRLLLAQLGVREFDPKAQIKAPPLKIVVKGVACPHCDASVDVDVGTGGGFPGLPLAIGRPDGRLNALHTALRMDLAECGLKAVCQSVQN